MRFALQQIVIHTTRAAEIEPQNAYGNSATIHYNRSKSGLEGATKLPEKFPKVEKHEKAKEVEEPRLDEFKGSWRRSPHSPSIQRKVL